MKEFPYQVAVAELSQSPYFKVIVEKIRSLEPVVPSYDYEGNSNIEKIKARLSERAMYERVMSILSPKGKVE